MSFLDRRRPGGIGARPGAALAFIAVTVCLDAVAQSISFPILPRLAASLLGGDLAAASRWTGVLEVAWALPQFFAAPVLGMLSDRFGRRPVIVISVFGVGAELIVGALAPTIWWLLLARIYCGLACGAQATAMAYVADITPPEQRTQRFGALNAAFWTGIIVGPALGGLLAGIDIRAPFWAAAAAAIANGLYGLFVLPESLAPENRSPMRWTNANPWGAVSLMVSRPGLPILGLALMFCWLGFQSKDNMIVLYTAVRYGWNPMAFGLFATGLALAMIAVLSRLAGALSRRIGDPRTALIGLTFQTLGFVAIRLAPTGAWFWAANIPTVLGAVGGPALQAMLSARVGPDEQGRLQGAIGSLSSLTGIVAPLAAAQVFAWSIGGGRPPGWSGLVILIGAGLSLTALALVAASLRRPAPLRPGPSAAI